VVVSEAGWDGTPGWPLRYVDSNVIGFRLKGHIDIAHYVASKSLDMFLSSNLYSIIVEVQLLENIRFYPSYTPVLEGTFHLHWPDSSSAMVSIASHLRERKLIDLYHK